MSRAYLVDLFGLDGQVAVVIGGTGVLGGALCDGISRAGATVVVAGRTYYSDGTVYYTRAYKAGEVSYVLVQKP